MPSINNVRLEIHRLEDNRLRRVNVKYQICFTSCEALAQATFVERVLLVGADDPPFNPDDHLMTLRNSCVRAQRGCIERSLSTTVFASRLDEDDPIFIISDGRDEIYARVTLTPFVAGTASAKSNQVNGQFGPGS